jgi:dihydroorotate dehydrogenase
MPNEGLRSVLKKHRKTWEDLHIPVIVHVILEEQGDLEQMLAQLEAVECVAGVELGLEVEHASEIAELLPPSLIGELPIIVRLPVTADQGAFLAAAELQPAALSLGPGRGVIAVEQTGIRSGRIYGPSTNPYALWKLQRLVEIVSLPLIAAGGITSPTALKTALELGAAAVQLDTVLWTAPQSISPTLISSDLVR